MMRETMLLAAALMAIIAAGWSIQSLLIRRCDGLTSAERAALAYGLGAGSISLEMLFFSYLKLSFTMPAILAPWVPVAAAAAIITIRERSVAVRREAAASGLLPAEKALIAGISSAVAYAFFRALVKPIESYDAVAIYAIKSKIFFLGGGFPPDFFSGLMPRFPHPDYPLGIPLVETFLYTAMGSWNDQLVKIIFPLYYSATLILLYGAIRRFSGRLHALVFVFILATVPQFNDYATNAYHEVPLTFYCLASLIFILRWFEQRDRARYIVLAAVFAGLAAWTKNEGLLYCCIETVLIAIFLTSRGRNLSGADVARASLFIVVIALLLAPWALTKASYKIANDEINLANVNAPYLARHADRFGPVLYEFQKQFFGPKKWNILWPAALVIFVAHYRRALRGIGGYLAVYIALAVAGYMLFYMISRVDVVFFVGKTWSRFLLHFLPAVVLWLAWTLKEDPALPK